MNISELFKKERPTDRIIKVLSNKFLLAQCMYDNGTFAKAATVFGLDNGKFYSYGHTDNNTLESFRWLSDWIRERVEIMPTVERTWWRLGNSSVYVLKTTKNKKYKQKYRRLLRLIS